MNMLCGTLALNMLCGTLALVALILAVRVWELTLDLRATKMERNRYLAKLQSLPRETHRVSGIVPGN